jgi:U1 small nuclear ribonucleoprotein
LDYKTDERKLKGEFEHYGRIKNARIVKDFEGKSRGYGFIEFEHQSDFKTAYKKSDKKRIDNRKVLVDYERARTVKDFKPRRLGGGKGNSRAFPFWMEKDLNEMRERYPEIVFKGSKKEPENVEMTANGHHHEPIEHVAEAKIETPEVNVFINKKRPRSESKSSEANLVEDINSNPKENIEGTNDMEVDDDSDSDGGKKKKKKAKKEKKSKKDKKEKKSKKDKRKKDQSPEIGEIIDK